jgi:ornithine decarboxylase
MGNGSNGLTRPFSLYGHISKERFQKIKQFSRDKETPFLVLDLERVSQKYDELTKNLPDAKVYYAVKANPDPRVLGVLADKGSNFDIASRYELDQLLGLGISVDRLSFGNTIKKAEDIRYAYEKGVRLFATDSRKDIEKLAENAAGSKVFVRLLVSNKGADWPLSKKFGTTKEHAIELLDQARDLGLVPYGLSFHVGSQQRDPTQWDDPLEECAQVFSELKTRGIELRMVNMGGGLPASYLVPTPPIEEYAKAIHESIRRHFPAGIPELITEPGRSVVADSGVIVSDVVLVSRKGKRKWVYLDIGICGGLFEALGESIKYPIYTEDQGKLTKMTLAGPTCDSVDVMYKKASLPDDIEEGDKVYILTAGAYTISNSFYGFNGFPPLKVYHL